MTPRSNDKSDRVRLLIDEAAAADIPAQDDSREWAKSQRAFISSVMTELAAERRAVADGARNVGVRPVMFEDFGGRDDDPGAAYLAEVRSSAIYLGIIGRRYGKPLKSRFSATHTEYRQAEESGLRICVWALDTNDREGPEQSFLDEVRTFHVANVFGSASDLRQQVERRLREIAAEDLSPWCKLGNVIFRATRIVDRGDEIDVEARVRSDEVGHALEAMRGDQWGRGFEGGFTWEGRSRGVAVRAIETVTTTARSKLCRLRLEPRENRRDPFLDVSCGRFSPEDLTEIGLRATLFGEQNPLENQHLGFAAEIPNPLEPLVGRRMSEETVRPIANLLLLEALVGSGRATRIVRLTLGVPIRDRRKMVLGWVGARRFSNEEPREFEISGEVVLP
jgi:hypothetical protein